MIALAEPVTTTAPPFRSDPSTALPPRRQVVVVVDACSELSPAVAADLGVRIMPRRAKIDRQIVTLDEGRTLHHDCWPKLPRSIAFAPYTLGDLAQTYEQILNDGLSVLALHVPGRLDSAVRVALAARSILLAGRYNAPDHAPRVAVYELGAIGLDFTFLVQVAAHGAAEGLTLQQLSTLIDRIQALLSTLYLTTRAPIEALRGPRAAAAGRWGREQIWQIDRSLGGLLSCRARGGKLAHTLFAPGGLLHGTEPTALRCNDPRLLQRINQARTRLDLPTLEATPGVGLTQIFRGGCVELGVFPNEVEITRIIDVIRRIDRFAPAPSRAARPKGV